MKEKEQKNVSFIFIFFVVDLEIDTANWFR
jgi:hypothetical protein